MTTLLLLRHGQSEGNRDHRFLGWQDGALSEMGRRQAELVAQALRKRTLAAVYTSDLQRACQTALPAAREHGVSLIREPALREINAGEWEGHTYEELCERDGEAYRIWLEDVGRAVCTGGESVAQLSERVWTCIQRLARENEGCTVLIVTHATPIRTLLTRWQGKPLSEMKDVPWVDNASLTEVRVENGVFTPVSVNQTAHLGSVISKFPANV